MYPPKYIWITTHVLYLRHNQKLPFIRIHCILKQNQLLPGMNIQPRPIRVGEHRFVPVNRLESKPVRISRLRLGSNIIQPCLQVYLNLPIIRIGIHGSKAGLKLQILKNPEKSRIYQTAIVSLKNLHAVYGAPWLHVLTKNTACRWLGRLRERVLYWRFKFGQARRIKLTSSSVIHKPHMSARPLAYPRHPYFPLLLLGYTIFLPLFASKSLILRILAPLVPMLQVLEAGGQGGY